MLKAELENARASASEQVSAVGLRGHAGRRVDKAHRSDRRKGLGGGGMGMGYNNSDGYDDMSLGIGGYGNGMDSYGAYGQQQQMQNSAAFPKARGLVQK